MNINQDIIKETNKLWGFEYMTALCMEEFAYEDVYNALGIDRKSLGY